MSDQPETSGQRQGAEVDVPGRWSFPECDRCGWAIARDAYRCEECKQTVHDDCPCACPVQLPRGD